MIEPQEIEKVFTPLQIPRRLFAKISARAVSNRSRTIEPVILEILEAHFAREEGRAPRVAETPAAAICRRVLGVSYPKSRSMTGIANEAGMSYPSARQAVRRMIGQGLAEESEPLRESGHLSSGYRLTCAGLDVCAADTQMEGEDRAVADEHAFMLRARAAEMGRAK